MGQPPVPVVWDQRPDRRTRRALLHLQYSCATPCGPAMLVTQDPGGYFRGDRPSDLELRRWSRSSRDTAGILRSASGTTGLQTGDGGVRPRRWLILGARQWLEDGRCTLV